MDIFQGVFASARSTREIKSTSLQPPPLFDLKTVYSYVTELADSESDLNLHCKSLVSEK